MGELIPIDMLFASDSIEFQFDFMDNGAQQAFFKYQTFDVNGFLPRTKLKTYKRPL